MAALVAVGLVLSACATTGIGTDPDASATPAEPAQAAPAPKDDERPAPGSRPWAGVFSPLATLSYAPLKMFPCSLGVLGAVAGFLFTFDVRMVQDTLTLNCGGDWIVTPGMLQGRESLRGVGRIEELRGPSAPAPSPPAAAVPPILEPGTE